MKVTEFEAGQDIATYDVTVDVLRSATFLFVTGPDGKILSFDIDRDEWDAMIRQHEQVRAMQAEEDKKEK